MTDNDLHNWGGWIRTTDLLAHVRRFFAAFRRIPLRSFTISAHAEPAQARNPVLNCDPTANEIRVLASVAGVCTCLRPACEMEVFADGPVTWCLLCDRLVMPAGVAA